MVDMSICAEKLRSGVKSFDFALSDEHFRLLLEYLRLFSKWNESYNLSSIRQPEDMVSKHLLDSLSIVTMLAQSPASRIIDVGTGGGLPGIPLSIMFPERAFTLLDSAGKKTRFLQQTAHILGLKNVNVVNKRVESYFPDNPFHVVISRAFASIPDMVGCCTHLLDEHGEFWAMKGAFPEDELSDLEKQYKVKSHTRLEVPANESDSIGERCLIKIHMKKIEK